MHLLIVLVTKSSEFQTRDSLETLTCVTSGVTSGYFRIRHDSFNKSHVPASRNNARANPNVHNVSFTQPTIAKKNSPPNITIVKTNSNAGQLKVSQQMPLRHTLSDNKYPNKRKVGRTFFRKCKKLITFLTNNERETRRNLSPTPSLKSCRSETCPEMLESYSPVPERGPSQFETDDFRLTMCNDYEA